MKIHYLIPALLLIGCASHQPVSSLDPGPLPQKTSHQLAQARAETIRVPEGEKAYPVGRYEDPDDPSVMHEGHTIYRVENSPTWNLEPNTPTTLPLGPTVAVADPDREHVALTAELEEKLKREDQLLQVTYAQNQRLTEEIEKMQEMQPHLRLPEPPDNPAQPAVAPPQPPPPTNAPPATPEPPVAPTPVPSQSSLWHWLWPASNPNQKGQNKP